MALMLVIKWATSESMTECMQAPVERHGRFLDRLLNPAGASESVAFAVSNGQQVGYARFGDQDHAGMWTGAAASWVDLSPPGTLFSFATAVADGWQVGYALMGDSTYHAFRWTGTAASWVDLNPAGASSSFGTAAGPGQQAGNVELTPGVVRAALWSGNAASWLDLTPAIAAQAEIRGAGGGQQVGNTIAYDYDYDYSNQFFVGQASLWSGTAASWRSLNPAGASFSLAYGADAGLQVGFAAFGGLERAGVWGGSPDTWVDLAAYLSPDDPSVNTDARGVSHDGNIVYVVGYSLNGTTGDQQALMWAGHDCNPLLSFSSQPSSITYVSGGTASLSVATNMPASSLQWRHDGAPMADGPNVSGSATSSLTITSTQDSDVGIYDCVAVGICNTVPSNPVVLTCNPILIMAPPLHVLLRPTAQIAVTAAPDVSYSYQWRRDSVNLTDTPDQLSGTLTPTLTFISGDASLTGHYDVVVTDSCGTTISRVAEVRICFADFNGDGDTGTDSDIEAFFACLAGNCCSTCGSADFNGDGDVGTDADIESFFRVLGGEVADQTNQCRKTT